MEVHVKMSYHADFEMQGHRQENMTLALACPFEGRTEYRRQIASQRIGSTVG